MQAHGEKPVMIWSRLGYTSGISRLKVILKRGRAETEQNAKHVYPAHASVMPNPLIRRLWLMLALIDLLWLYAIRVRWLLFCGKLVVLDRYLADALVDVCTHFANDNVETWWLWRLLNTLAPEPMYQFFVLVPLDVSLARRAERDGTGRRAGGAIARHQRPRRSTIMVPRRTS